MREDLLGEEVIWRLELGQADGRISLSAQLCILLWRELLVRADLNVLSETVALSKRTVCKSLLGLVLPLDRNPGWI